jgi:hypothetical protein
MPLTALKNVKPNPRFEHRVATFAQIYTGGGKLPPIPVRIDKHGQLHLARDGNHRLAAAKLAGLAHVDTFCPDERDNDELCAIARRAARLSA